MNSVEEVRRMSDGALAQLGERGLCKPEVRGSIPLCSTKNPDGSSSEDPFSLRSASKDAVMKNTGAL